MAGLQFIALAEQVNFTLTIKKAGLKVALF